MENGGGGNDDGRRLLAERLIKGQFGRNPHNASENNPGNGGEAPVDPCGILLELPQQRNRQQRVENVGCQGDKDRRVVHVAQLAG